MLHSSSGFRGTRVGATDRSAPRNQPDDVVGERLPRIRVSYWCAKGHVTRPVFVKLPEEQIPSIWDCRSCGEPASRNMESPMRPDSAENGFKSHLDYVKERRSGQDAEDVLGRALERLRAR